MTREYSRTQKQNSLIGLNWGQINSWTLPRDGQLRIKKNTSERPEQSQTWVIMYRSNLHIIILSPKLFYSILNRDRKLPREIP